LSDREIEARRGTIYDSQGNVLAQSATVYNIFIDPSKITDKNRTVLVDLLTEVLGYNSEKRDELVEKTHKEGKYVIVERKVEYKIRKALAEFMDADDNKKYKLRNCLGFEETTRRYYPYGKLASPVLGFVGSDNQGLEGIEAYYDEALQGVNGRIITVADAASKSISDDFETTIPAEDGNSLVLTLNSSIQHTLETGLQDILEEYDAKGTYGVVMDVQTGAVLAMASLPGYDCNNPRTVVYDKYIEEIKKETDADKKAELESAYVQKQWRNFTVSDTYVTGSVYKTFMAAAALEENVVNLNTSFTCTGSIKVADWNIKCHIHAGHGTQNLTQGLGNSCNPFFITIGQRLGVHNYFKYFDGFGFTERTGIDLPGEAAPQFYTENQYGIVELSSASFGQTNNVSPIQMCTALSAVANGGRLLKPYLVSEIKDVKGNTVSKTQTTERRQVISEDTSEKVLDMMTYVVENGTGRNARVAGYKVGGKTGTSEKLGEYSDNERKKYIISFSAIAPTDDPRVAMIIICDEPNQDLGGGTICAPIAASVVEECMKQLGVEPSYTADELKNKAVKIPAVAGKSVDEAKSQLSGLELKSRVVGNGNKVIKQTPTADSEIPRNGTVVLYTESNKEQTVKVPDFTGLTISEANRVASSHNLNIRISGNDSTSANVVAYKQSESKDSEVAIGTVITVSFKSNHAVLD
ncbi:MAG: PASTA domain-containing protein, partial [Eubacterium sp.]